MKITIDNDGQKVTVEISVEVYECLDEYDHKSENLAHEQRRHWDERECDEYIIASEGRLPPQETPEDVACRRETLDEIMSVLNTCTAVQRKRFILYALYDLSYAEVGKLCGCSKIAVFQSVEAVRKKCKDFFTNLLND